MKLTVALIALIPFGLAGCAERILAKEESVILGTGAATNLLVAQKGENVSLLGQASNLAADLASAFFAAGVKASRTQDVINSGVYLAAGSVAVGALGSASDQALTNRALTGIGLQSIGQNGLQKSEIQSLFAGAKQLNCIAGISRIHTRSNLKDDRVAQQLVYAAIQDVRISARNVLVRDVETFANVLKTINDAISRDGGEAEIALDGTKPNPTTLSKFAKDLGGCITSDGDQNNED